MPAEWAINYWPPCGSLAFLSHCAEDRERLIRPVYKMLAARWSPLAPWVDWHHFPAAIDAFEALRENLLQCRHVVYFITPALLRQARGWVNAERAFGATIQHRLRYYDHEVAHVELPLLFVPRSDPVLRRSAWRGLLDKALDCPNLPGRSGRQAIWNDDGKRDWSKQHVEWAVSRIDRFISQEEDWAVQLAERFRQDDRLRVAFSTDENLKRRVLALSPRRPG